MSYLARIDSLDYSRSVASPARHRVALLTGQSSFRSSRLTDDQMTLLRAVPNATPLPLGFPFHPEFDVVAPQPGILAASFRNALQFVWSLRPQRPVARALQPLFTNTSECLTIVTGSCGLQLLNAAWPLLERPPTLQVRIIALGPAGFHHGLEAITIQGRRDFWSRLLYRGPVHAASDCGHLDYWHSTQVHQLVKDACA